MRRILRVILPLLAAPGLTGCVWAFEPIRYTVSGPATSFQLVEAGRALRSEDRLALVVARPREDARRVAGCVASGLASQLPGGRPSPVIPDPAAATQILALVEPLLRTGGLPRAGDALPAEVEALGLDWIVVVEDHSASDITTGVDRSLVPGRSDPGRQEVRAGRTVRYRLALVATLLDIRGQRVLGTVRSSFDTQGGAYMIVSGVGLGGWAGPMLEVPAGTGAMTLCSRFGYAVGNALVRVAAPPPPAPQSAPSR